MLERISKKPLISSSSKSMRVEKFKANCPKCGCQFETTCPICGQIARAARMTVTELHNGGLNTVTRKLEFATLVIDRAGIEFDQQKLVSQAFEAATKAFADKRLEEETHRHYEQMEVMKRGYEQQNKPFIDKLNERIVELTKEFADEKNRNKELTNEIVRLRTELTVNPARKGDKPEKDMTTTLKLAFPNDEIIPAMKGKNEIDVVQKVNQDKKPIGKIVIECKNVKQWSSKWISTTLEHMQRENTFFGIISTTVMPNETNLNPLGLDKEGVLITLPENTKWAVAAYRVALIRSDSAMRKLQDERQRMLKQKEIKEKLLRLIDNKDFQTVFDACKNIKEKSQSIRNKASKVKSDMSAISDDTESIDDIVEIVIRSNSKLSEAFDSLSE